MKEPARIKTVDRLVPYVAIRVKVVLSALKARGFDPIVFESLRTDERQRYLYAIGRTIQKNRKPVTYTMHSRHMVGKAADIISKSRGWDHPAFFKALKEEASKVGMKTLSFEACHIQFGD